LNAVFDITRRFIDAMATRRWGRVINISSIVGRIGNFGQANYAAAKAGLIGLTKALPILLAGKTMPPRKAMKAGLVDEVVRPEALRAGECGNGRLRQILGHCSLRNERFALRRLSEKFPSCLRTNRKRQEYYRGRKSLVHGNIPECACETTALSIADSKSICQGYCRARNPIAFARWRYPCNNCHSRRLRWKQPQVQHFPATQ
jgi:ribosomal protein L40E